jgi:hypothetical protein
MALRWHTRRAALLQMNVGLLVMHGGCTVHTLCCCTVLLKNDRSATATEQSRADQPALRGKK